MSFSCECGACAPCPDCDCKPAEQPPEVPARDDADRPLPEDAAIKAAHPSRTGRHDLYAEAMRLVGAKHSKRALVDLVNWLLATRAK